MKEVKFGSKQYGNPTPVKVNNIVQVFTVIAAAVLAWVGTANFIPANVSTVIQSVLGLLITIANGLKPFFGVETNQKKVDIEDVGSMDTKQ